MMTKKNIVISLYDLTGVMVKPWLEAGFTCYIVDHQHKPGINKHSKIPNLFTVGTDLRYGWLPPRNIIDSVVFMAAFPECTNVAVSGAAHFIKKGPRALALGIELFATAKEIGEFLNCPYMIENPVSTLSSYCGKPNYIFNPYEYGGYLPEDDRHPRWPEYIAPRDSYPKKTCLWTNEAFIMPPKKQVTVPEGYSRQHTQLGGKSQRVKNIRSETPRGFAAAVFESNSPH